MDDRITPKEANLLIDLLTKTPGMINIVSARTLFDKCAAIQNAENEKKKEHPNDDQT